eukprot:CAMPEP_0168401474 /NCGR_PEP_ID=MMETSP0228-20121227/23130_1 /TAXON_ID=133427 /ORGANISM="Protoceratium reticulatum, Strain CCCM 535 (=CCMP 1889)" /LENGTH=136 /DNA_ID=CAMNT_0008415043 /DNA_START=118 /DNA_END=528 /DNA_ORIENTATION=+
MCLDLDPTEGEIDALPALLLRWRHRVLVVLLEATFHGHHVSVPEWDPAKLLARALEPPAEVARRAQREGDDAGVPVKALEHDLVVGVPPDLSTVVLVHVDIAGVRVVLWCNAAELAHLAADLLHERLKDRRRVFQP